MNREDYKAVYTDAKLIFQDPNSTWPIRVKAKRVTKMMERIVGQLDAVPAETWIAQSGRIPS